MSDVTAPADLGVCDAFIAGPEQRCPGWLIVDRELGDLIEARCSLCDSVAARPARKAPDGDTDSGAVVVQMTQTDRRGPDD